MKWCEKKNVGPKQRGFVIGVGGKVIVDDAVAYKKIYLMLGEKVDQGS